MPTIPIVQLSLAVCRQAFSTTHPWPSYAGYSVASPGATTVAGLGAVSCADWYDSSAARGFTADGLTWLPMEVEPECGDGGTFSALSGCVPVDYNFVIGRKKCVNNINLGNRDLASCAAQTVADLRCTGSAKIFGWDKLYEFCHCATDDCGAAARMSMGPEYALYEAQGTPPPPPRTCADTNADGRNPTDDPHDCSAHANDLSPSPAGITCAADPCTDAECCTVVPAVAPAAPAPPSMGGTMQAPLTLAASASDADDYYNGMTITTGGDVVAVGVITDYIGSDRTFTASWSECTETGSVCDDGDGVTPVLCALSITTHSTCGTTYTLSVSRHDPNVPSPFCALCS